MRRYLLPLVVLALVAWGSFVAWSQPPFQDCIDKHQREEADRQHYEDAEKLPYSFFIYAGIDTTCAGHFVHRNEGAITAFATIVIAFFTLTLWRSTDKLWAEANEAGRIAKGAADAAKAAADAARESVENAKTSAEMQLRAYINVREAKVKWKIDETISRHRFSITVKVTNAGQTPARKATGWIAHKSVDSGESPRPFHELTGHEQPSVSVYGPGQSSWFAYSPIVVVGEDEDVIAWSTGRKRLYVWGRMDYEDAFGKSRWTTFRFEMPQEACGRKGGRFRACAEGNDYT